MISSSLITKAIIDKLKDSKKMNSDIKDFTEKLILFLNKNHLIYLLPNIIKNLEDHKKREEKINTIEIITSHQFSDESIEKIKSYISKWDPKKIKISIDPKIIGGVIIKGKNNIVDASIKRNIQSLKESLIK